MLIEFIFEREKFRIFDQKKVSKWLSNVIENEKRQLGSIVYNFVTGKEILRINNDFLNHDYYTDIITFDETFVNIINGTIFISPDTVKYNSKKLDQDAVQELYRVIVLGIMHLCGYCDSTEVEKVKMRELEDKYLAYLEKL